MLIEVEKSNKKYLQIKGLNVKMRNNDPCQLAKVGSELPVPGGVTFDVRFGTHSKAAVGKSGVIEDGGLYERKVERPKGTQASQNRRNSG